MFKKDGKYFSELPKDANPDDYTVEWVQIFNTGGKDATTVPIGKSTIGDNLYDAMFKTGSVKTLITPEDGWFLGNAPICTVDNSLMHISNITGHNKRKREEYYDTLNNYGIPKSKMAAIDLELDEKMITDNVEIGGENIDNIIANMELPGIFTQPRFDLKPKEFEKVLDKVVGMKRTKLGAEEVFNALGPNTSRGITQDDLRHVITEGIKTKLKEKNPAERQAIYESLLKKYTKRWIPSLRGTPYIKYDYDPKIFNNKNIGSSRAMKSLVGSAAATGILIGVKSLNPLTAIPILATELILSSIL